ncbi:hypothetical protein LINPERHAP1_LOCUS34762 [Linum perenne]
MTSNPCWCSTVSSLVRMEIAACESIRKITFLKPASQASCRPRTAPLSSARVMEQNLRFMVNANRHQPEPSRSRPPVVDFPKLKLTEPSVLSTHQPLGPGSQAMSVTLLI